jgi:lysophospholipase L1-like esterase
MKSWKWLTLLGVLAITVAAPAQVPKKNANPNSIQQQKKKKTAARRPQNAAFARVEDVPGLPRVLILGDSISIGYTLPLRHKLEGKANVHRPAANCGPTTTALKSLDHWLGDGKWNVIHFNHGLHDLKFVDDQGKNTSPEQGHRQVSLEDYEKNLNTIVARLRATGAKLIFATTTPVPPDEPQRKVGDDRAYNEVALKVMRERGVAIDDLYAAVAPEFARLAIRPGNVHFSPEGYDFLATRAAASIETALAAEKTITLFNGKDLEGWSIFLRHADKSDPRADPKQVFQVEDGVIHISGEEFGYIITDKEFDNYRFSVEFKWGEKKWPPREKPETRRDSGILYHCVGPDKVWPKSIECQVQEHDCGDFFLVGGTSILHDGETYPGVSKGEPKKKLPGRIVKSKDTEKPRGEWNTVEVICEGGKATHIVNGEVVNEGTNASVTRGKILLQSEGAEVYYRNILLRPLGQTTKAATE